MQLTNERLKKYYEYDFDMSPEEESFLIDYGLKNIKNDKKELINYAIIHILTEQLKGLDVDDKPTKKNVKKQKKGNKNESN